jgi:hypothetical protein
MDIPTTYNPKSVAIQPRSEFSHLIQPVRISLAGLYYYRQDDFNDKLADTLIELERNGIVTCLI